MTPTQLSEIKRVAESRLINLQGNDCYCVFGNEAGHRSRCKNCWDIADVEEKLYLLATLEAKGNSLATLESAASKAVNYRSTYQRPLVDRLAELADGFDSWNHRAETALNALEASRARVGVLESLLKRCEQKMVSSPLQYEIERTLTTATEQEEGR